jgi:hypothetical protein
VIAVATIVIAVATIKYTTYARRQWEEMHSQVQALVAGVKQNETLITLAKDQLEVIRQTADAAQGSAETAEVQTRITRRMLEIGERPWVGMESIKMTSAFVANEPLTTAIVIRNTGSSPGINVVGKSRVAWGPGELPEDPPYGEGDSPGSVGTLFPGNTVSHTLETTRGLSAQEIEAIKGGRMFFYVFGFIEYDDIFGKRHKTRYCGHYRPTKGQLFSICSRYNDAN